jgi:hypothetical protein
MEVKTRESETVGQTTLPQVQDRQAQGHRLRDLRESQAQAATRVERSTVKSQASMGRPRIRGRPICHSIGFAQPISPQSGKAVDRSRQLPCRAFNPAELDYSNAIKWGCEK